MTDWASSGRRDTYSFSLADPFTLADVATLDAIPSSCSITYGYYTDNWSTASIQEVNSDFRIQGRDMLVRVRHHIECDGETVDEELGTFFVDSPPRRSKSGMVTRNLSCYSTLWRLSQDSLADDMAGAKGANVIQAIGRLITYAGGQCVVDYDAPTARTFGAHIGFPIGSNRLETINTIAGWIGCTVEVDGHGRQVIRKYVEPGLRPSVYTFEDGANCVYQSGLDWSSTRSDAINRAIMFFTRESKPNDEDPSIPLSARAVADLPDTESFSYERAGRRRTEVITVSDYCTQAELDARAKRYVWENGADQTSIEINHPSIPGVTIGSVVDYRNSIDDTEPLSFRCMITEQNISSLGPGCMTSSKLKILRWY